MAKNFWLIIERGSYLATLFIGLVEMCEFTAAHLFQRFLCGATGDVTSIAGGSTFYFTVIVHKDIPYIHDRISNNVAQFLRHNNTTILITQPLHPL